MKILEIIRLILDNREAIQELIEFFRNLTRGQVLFANGQPVFNAEQYPALHKLEQSPEFQSIVNKAA